MQQYFFYVIASLLKRKLKGSAVFCALAATSLSYPLTLPAAHAYFKTFFFFEALDRELELVAVVVAALASATSFKEAGIQLLTLIKLPSTLKNNYYYPFPSEIFKSI